MSDPEPVRAPGRAQASLSAVIDLVDHALKWVDKVAWLPRILMAGALLGGIIAIGLTVRSGSGGLQLVVLVMTIVLVALPATASRRLRRAAANRDLAIDELRQVAKNPSVPVRAAVSELGVTAQSLLHGSTLQRLRAGIRLADPVSGQLRDGLGHVGTVALAASSGLQLLVWSVVVVPIGVALILLMGLGAALV